MCVCVCVHLCVHAHEHAHVHVVVISLPLKASMRRQCCALGCTYNKHKMRLTAKNNPAEHSCHQSRLRISMCVYTHTHKCTIGQLATGNMTIIHTYTHAYIPRQGQPAQTDWHRQPADTSAQHLPAHRGPPAPRTVTAIAQTKQFKSINGAITCICSKQS